jgi:hypothetical protein
MSVTFAHTQAAGTSACKHIPNHNMITSRQSDQHARVFCEGMPYRVPPASTRPHIDAHACPQHSQTHAHTSLEGVPPNFCISAAANGCASPCASLKWREIRSADGTRSQTDRLGRVSSTCILPHVVLLTMCHGDISLVKN